MNSQLFKSTEFYQKRYQNFSTIIIFPLVLLIMFLLSFLLWAKKEVTVEVTGTIEPTSIVATIQSTSDNTIIKNQLRSNKEVKKGDLLIQYSEKMESSQKESLQKQFDLLSRQETGLKTLEDSINQGTSLFQEENDEFGYQSTFTNTILLVKVLIVLIGNQVPKLIWVMKQILLVLLKSVDFQFNLRHYQKQIRIIR